MADDYYAAMNSMFEVGSSEFFRLALMVRILPSMINDLLYCCCDPAYNRDWFLFYFVQLLVGSYDGFLAGVVFDWYCLMPADGIRWFHVWISKSISIFVPPFHDKSECFIMMPSHGKFERLTGWFYWWKFWISWFVWMLWRHPMGLDGFPIGTWKKLDELETLIRH